MVYQALHKIEALHPPLVQYYNFYIIPFFYFYKLSSPIKIIQIYLAALSVKLFVLVLQMDVLRMGSMSYLDFTMPSLRSLTGTRKRGSSETGALHPTRLASDAGQSPSVLR